MGGSLRRTRGKAKESGTRKSRGGGKRLRGRASGGKTRLALQFLALVLFGWVAGYLISTQLLYPAPAPATDLVTVPDVHGMGVDSARERLASTHLQLGDVDSLRYPTVARDVILGQSPLAGQLARPGAAVAVTRSLGPQRRSVPDVSHVDAERAHILLETSGFLVALDSVEADVPRGRVVETIPGPGQIVALPAEIRVEVSKGPPLVPMPLLLGLQKDEALSVLDSLGLVADEVEEVFRFGRDQGIVVEQQPPADSLMARGSAVHLSVGKGGS